MVREGRRAWGPGPWGQGRAGKGMLLRCGRCPEVLPLSDRTVRRGAWAVEGGCFNSCCGMLL